ncbi:hypothetical protein [Streptomyces longwoodensis]|uniref:hypothetical protein n=1 Tax=Streptomyces longwoodensis TaxID=68231 RepID=UPI00225A9594|nr:hypothetical protein [Streptomyces longwoodensis]MCX4993807.1 hypothetical protein [Streptomyces longwoodensis]MCX4998073.1 hypothetical protein [Streptomyces longwoodensis]
MSAAALAATPAAQHPQPHTAAAGVPARDGGLTVKVPLRLVVGAQYPDVALSTYVKVKALALRPEGCRAKVVTLAGYLGMSKSSLERGLRPLRNPDPVDGLVEIPTARKTARGGTGESAHRVTRPLADGELWVRIPVRAAEALTPRLLRLYALLAYATARRIPVTAAELGEMLRHHTGKRAGEHLGERQARRLVDELEATGWLTVHRREGAQGRHAYETRRHPLRAVPAPPAAQVPAGTDGLEDQESEQLALWGPAAPVIHDGSGPDLGDGSLASKEDLQTDRRLEAQVGGGIRRRRGDRKWAARPVDNRVPPALGGAPLAQSADDETPTPGPAAGRPAYTGPALQLSPRVWRVLAPVRHELPGISAYMLRRIARETGAQLDAPGGDEDRLTDRLTRRYATTTTIRDIGRWLLGAALVRHGCGDPRCETGVIWPTGADCETCAVNRQVAAARARRDAELAERARLLEEERLRRLRAAQALEERPARALPPKKTYRQRTRASDDEIRAVIAEQGPVVALHLYGHLRALPLLDGHDPNPTPGNDRRTHAQ